MNVSPSADMSIYLSVCLSVCLSIIHSRGHTHERFISCHRLTHTHTRARARAHARGYSLSLSLSHSHTRSQCGWSPLSSNRLVRLESRRSQVRIPLAPGFFSGSSHTSDLKIGTPVATLPGAWQYRVSTGTGRPGVSILWLGEVELLICNFCLSVAARKIEQIRPWDTLACCWNVKQPTNKQTNTDLDTN